MRLLWDERAWEDYLYWQIQDKKTLKRINSLIKDIQRNPFEGIGKPEPLSGAVFQYPSGRAYFKESGVWTGTDENAEAHW